MSANKVQFEKDKMRLKQISEIESAVNARIMKKYSGEYESSKIYLRQIKNVLRVPKLY